MKIALLTSLDPRDMSSWSGVVFHIAEALEKHCGEVVRIGPISASKEMLIGKIAQRGSRLFYKKNFMYYHGTLVARRYAKVAAQRLAGQDVDIIVAPTGAPETAFLETDTPIVLVEDATFGLLHNYYSVFSNLLEYSFRQLDTIERLATQKASLLIYPSAWAARSAIEEYGADRSKVHILPLGANLKDVPSRETVLARQKTGRCKLLFVGVDWERKGGSIAFGTLLKLEEMGIEAELCVCGCVPPKGIVHPRLTVVPRLDKSDSAQYRKMQEFYLTSDFLLLPTRKECYGLVFCEASAYGLPSIATDTGGVAGAITNGENGFLLPPDVDGSGYAALIAELYGDDNRYQQLVVSSRNAFEARLNWDTWATQLNKLMIEVLARRQSISLSITSTPAVADAEATQLTI
jgi:glycosyltransferase involved in cell wall biosynthesis